MEAKKPARFKCNCIACRHHPRSAVARGHQAINRVLESLNEKNRRRFVGLLALQRGRGSLEQLNAITGLSCPTIRRGREEVQRSERGDNAERVRRAGAGRPRAEKNSPEP